MNIREINEAERTIKQTLGRNFIDDFCCGEDAGLNIELNEPSLTIGYHTALRILDSNYDDDKITDDEYNRVKECLNRIYSYYKQTTNKRKNSINVNAAINGEEFIDLPDFIELGSPEAQIYIDMYKKYRIRDLDDDEKDRFDSTFRKEVCGLDIEGEQEIIEGYRTSHHF